MGVKKISLELVVIPQQAGLKIVFIDDHEI